MSVIEITNENFAEEVLNSDKPVLIDFWAAWCMPCKMLSPVVESIAEEYDNIKVGKVNVDEQLPLAQKFNVMNIPTLTAFNNGDHIATSVGIQSKEKILEMFD